MKHNELKPIVYKRSSLMASDPFKGGYEAIVNGAQNQSAANNSHLQSGGSYSCAKAPTVGTSASVYANNQCVAQQLNLNGNAQSVYDSAATLKGGERKRKNNKNNKKNKKTKQTRKTKKHHKSNRKVKSQHVKKNKRKTRKVHKSRKSRK